jgi:hypothetical protein
LTRSCQCDCGPRSEIAGFDDLPAEIAIAKRLTVTSCRSSFG